MRICLAIALSLVLTACETVSTTQPGVVGVDRQQTMLVSQQEIDQAAVAEYKKVIAQAQQKGVLDRNPQLVQRVRTVAGRLIPHTAAFRPDAPKWAWETHVIQDDQMNAWAMPGGKMVVYSGLIEKLKLNDDELAAIMGHEIAHSLREHARERVSREMATQLGVSVAGAVLGVGELGTQLGGMLAQVTFTLPHSRAQEIEADRLGVELAARAGYDPHAAVSVWQKMLQAGGGGGPQFLSTHPSPENRLADLKVYAERVMPLYQQARR
jgi:predicted Zn-dependent protease